MTAKVLWVNRETGIVTVRVQENEPPDIQVGDVVEIRAFTYPPSVVHRIAHMHQFWHIRLDDQGKAGAPDQGPDSAGGEAVRSDTGGYGSEPADAEALRNDDARVRVNA